MLTASAQVAPPSPSHPNISLPPPLPWGSSQLFPSTFPLFSCMQYLLCSYSLPAVLS